jgi:hypothetical protein
VGSEGTVSVGAEVSVGGRRVAVGASVESRGAGIEVDCEGVGAQAVTSSTSKERNRTYKVFIGASNVLSLDGLF